MAMKPKKTLPQEKDKVLKNGQLTSKRSRNVRKLLNYFLCKVYAKL